MKILFVQAGGTIDKDYPKKNKGYAFEIDEPAALRILARAEVGFEYEVVSLMKKDSLDMTEGDRATIREYCLGSSFEKIVITHGSDTLLATAKAIGQLSGKTIVLTAAFRPERFENSDADFNLGLAIGALNINKEGTFIAINGRLFLPENCHKNETTGQFEAL